ncbi:strawberry notch-like NTP hydrolase domain-containing protein [Bradyrhizobium cajani]|uniref:strawberry notch-like NTP hydrolase domain-containing protein n=1 Tax=Bradyrhizobium cajani TaxID=1928661 RepID=UPI00359C7C80
MRLTEVVLFTTHAALRADRRCKRLSRIRHIVEWLDPDVDGVAAFDESDVSAMTADVASAAINDWRSVFKVAEGLQCHCVHVMDVHRIELSGFNVTMRSRLKVYGLFCEIISWKLHVFIRANRIGAGIRTKVLEHYLFDWGTERGPNDGTPPARSGTSSCARSRGGVPLLSLEGPAPRQLLDGR